MNYKIGDDKFIDICTKFTVIENQLPLVFADIELYQKQVADIERKKLSMPFEWKQIVGKYYNLSLIHI